MFHATLPSGLQVTCRTVEELLALDEALANRARNLPVSATVRGVDGPVAVVTHDPVASSAGYMPPPKNVGLALRFLKTLVQAGERGIPALALAKEIGAEGTRGLGGVTAVVNRTLRELGLPSEDAYVTRDQGGETRWYAKPIATAIVDHLGHFMLDDL